MSTYFDDRAEEASDDDDEGSVDPETGESRGRRAGEGRVNGHADDDSSEEEDEDNEEAEREVAEGFIVDEDDEAHREERRRRRRHKRPREAPELDEEDLDLELGELNDTVQPEPSRYKRLKIGRRDDNRDINDIFDSDNEPDEDRAGRQGGEFDDFIEEDGPDQDGELRDEFEVSRRTHTGPSGMDGYQYAGMDEADIEDMRAAFGDGTEYDWALDLQNEEDEGIDAIRDLELKDVFEPSQLVERMLTDEDQIIRATDIPERYQLLRKPFAQQQDLTDEQTAERARQEVTFVSDMMLRKKRVAPSLVQPFRDLIEGILVLMNEEHYEVPFILQNRKDFLIDATKEPLQGRPPTAENGGVDYEVKATKLLDGQDLWEILDLDLKFRALAEKRRAVQKIYDTLESFSNVSDAAVEELLPGAETTEEVQDVQDYLNFQYSMQLKDVAAIQVEADGIQKRTKSHTGIFERIRASRAYSVVKGFGITPDNFAQSALEPNRRAYTDDPSERPDDMADQFTDEDYTSGDAVLKAAKAMFAEELAMSPRMKKFMRRTYFTESHFDCVRTEKGLRKIDEAHPYYEFKYLRNLSLPSALRRPDFFLQMLKAEQEGLVEVHVRLDNEVAFERSLIKTLESDNFSEVADVWNDLRKEVLRAALRKLQKPIIRQVKENVRTECENALARLCKEELQKKLDQAPYRPKDGAIGDEPRVLALTASAGNAPGSRDAVIWACIEDYRCVENGKFDDFRLGNPEKGFADGRDVQTFVDLVRRREPDVIAVSGFTPDTRGLYKDLQSIVEQYTLQTPEYADDRDEPRRDSIEVFMVNDEVARLFHTSERSTLDLPGLAPLAKYCVAIGRYLQSPLKEYVSLGRDLTSISLHSHQSLVPQEKLMRYLETAIIDIVNLAGVDINQVVTNKYTANLLPYVCGLGPRKAASLIQVINRNGGVVRSRQELVGDPDNGIQQAVTARIFANCASFLTIEYDDHEPTSEYLDKTRIHPEDYDLARKIAADGLELDEEDVKAEQEENGQSAVVRRMVREEKTNSLENLILEMYADQLDRVFHQKKRATLETIRAELITPFEELRPEVGPMSTNDMFTMLTGETRDTLVEGMIIPVSIRRTFVDHIEVRLDCGVEGTISENEYPSGIGGSSGTEARQVYQSHQIVQARLNFLDRRRLTATLSLREDAIRRGYQKDFERMPGEWDDNQEHTDKREVTKRIEKVVGHAQRVVKHPLFRPFDSTQAMEFLGPQTRGDCIIRPSSKGLDHLVVTWKVSDNVFQHIDVLELDKENEFSVGRILKIEGKYTYSDLDELIVNHVKAMAKKVDEIMADERFQGGSKAETEKWLNAYMEANPRRSMYAFCISRESPGHFLLCFKPNQHAKQQMWPVKVVPNAFQLQKNDYPTMDALKNGFKKLVVAGEAARARRAY